MKNHIRTICLTILGLGMMALVGYLCTINPDFVWFLLLVGVLSLSV